MRSGCPRRTPSPAPPQAFVARFGADRFTLDAVNSTGVLNASAWVRPVPDHLLAPDDYAARAAHQGRELFRALCSSCHTIDGYLAIRPLVRGKSADALTGVIARLASPVDAAGNATAWNAVPVHVKTWRNRRMPPFAGTGEERQMLAAYLALLGGADPSALGPARGPARRTARPSTTPTARPVTGRKAWRRSIPRAAKPAELYDMIGRLPAINEMMPAFDGTEEQRKALAEYLAALPRRAPTGGAR